MLYFAYGSNMYREQMQTRCPSAEFVAKALLPDYELAFTHYSDTRKCWVADIIEKRGASVWGVVYSVSDEDMRQLDLHEGYHPGRETGNAYKRFVVSVWNDGNKKTPQTAWVYKVELPIRAVHKTSQHYKSLLVDGASYWGLPEEYIKSLKAIPVEDDRRAKV